jgi:DNA polymerase-3 subunit epsilon
MDFETTGLTPGSDRVVEVSVLRLEGKAEPRLVLDTLVNPGRPVAATEIHGITDADILDAPTFDEVAGDVVRAIAGCVVASYNVYFDMKFLEYELGRSGFQCAPPHVCLMYLRPLLGLGERCCLEKACQIHGLAYEVTHMAASDCHAAAQLMQCYLSAFGSRGINTFADLAEFKKYKFTRSFAQVPVDASIAAKRPLCTHLKSRTTQTPSPWAAKPTRMARPGDGTTLALKSYWEALKAVVADLEVTEGEMEYLKQKKHQLGLANEQIRVLHARAFSSAIARFVDDQWLDDKEATALSRLRRCLGQLGWAPGD